MSETDVRDRHSANQLNPFTDKSGKTLTAEDIIELPEVKRRVKALKKLQFQKLEIDGQLEKAIFEVIQSKFLHKYKLVFEKRGEIISGSTEPTDEDCDFDLESQESEAAVHEEQPKVVGIPNFWLTALQNFSLIRDWIFKDDEPVLCHLIDIAVDYSENPSKLVLKFRFEPNEYFTNDVLTKEYEIDFGPNPNVLWDTNPYFAVKWKGSRIDWKSGKNLMKWKKSTKSEISNDLGITSFFCFFDPPQEPKEKSQFNEDLETQLVEDWRIALIIVRSLVPNAILCYTGDMNEDEDETESDSSESSGQYSDCTSDDSRK